MVSSVGVATIISPGTFLDLNGDSVKDYIQISSGSTASVYMGDTTKSFSMGYLNLMSQREARNSLRTVMRTQERIGREVGAIGAALSRVQIASTALRGRLDAGQEALLRLISADVAEEGATLVVAGIRQQIGASLLGQARVEPQLALRLLGA